MDHELKFRVGDTVRVVKNRFGSHLLAIGGEYVIEEAVKESRTGPIPMNYQEYLLEGAQDGKGWVAEDEIEAV